MTKPALSLLLALASFSAVGADYGSATVARVLSVYDGDTFRADVLNWQAIAGANIGIRIAGVDTPEIRGRCAKEKALAIQARDLVRDLLRDAQVVELRSIRRGKYFRLVADVYADGQRVADVLLARGLAAPYDGGRKIRDWCAGPSSP